MVLYTEFAYGSQFSGEKNYLKTLHLAAEILSKNPVSFFWDTLYIYRWYDIIYNILYDLIYDMIYYKGIIFADWLGRVAIFSLRHRLGSVQIFHQHVIFCGGGALTLLMLGRVGWWGSLIKCWHCWHWEAEGWKCWGLINKWKYNDTNTHCTNRLLLESWTNFLTYILDVS